MQLIFLLLWVIALGIWLTVIYFIRTQLRTIDTIRPRVVLVYYAMIAMTVVLFGVAMMNILNYRDDARPAATAPLVIPTETDSTRSLRSTSNEKVY